MSIGDAIVHVCCDECNDYEEEVGLGMTTAAKCANCLAVDVPVFAMRGGGWPALFCQPCIDSGEEMVPACSRCFAVPVAADGLCSPCAINKLRASRAAADARLQAMYRAGGDYERQADSLTRAMGGRS